MFTVCFIKQYTKKRLNIQRALLLPFWMAIFILLLGPVFAQEAHAAELETIIVQLKWLHQFQFAGYCAAVEKGFYSEEGLDVTLRERNPKTDPIDDVLKGEAQYGVADAGLLLTRMQNKPVILLSQVFQHSPLVFLSKKGSGICPRRL